jgi:hypothetical protein
MAKKYKLAFGHGVMIDNEDGTASYRLPATFSEAFRVRIADVTGFSVTKGDKALERTLKILGNGAELVSVSVNHGSSEKIEAWFRGQPQFRAAVVSAPAAAPGATVPLGADLVADELKKLAELRDAGVLTDAEFAERKSKLLG